MPAKHKTDEIRIGTGHEISIESCGALKRNLPLPLQSVQQSCICPPDVALAMGGPSQNPLFSKHSRGQKQAQILALEGKMVGIEIKKSCSSLKDLLGASEGEFHVSQAIPVARSRPKS